VWLGCVAGEDGLVPRQALALTEGACIVVGHGMLWARNFGVVSAITVEIFRAHFTYPIDSIVAWLTHTLELSREGVCPFVSGTVVFLTVDAKMVDRAFNTHLPVVEEPVNTCTVFEIARACF